MVKTPDDNVPLSTNSSSITEETKVKFNKLLSEAINKEVSVTPHVFKKSTSAEKSGQSVGVPKIVPRQRKKVTTPEFEYTDVPGDISSIYSSEDSTGIKRVKRQVIEAEVHSSRTHLVQSSSDDDIISKKKEKKKKKKSRWKQDRATMDNEGLVNEVFEMNEMENRSSSRLSGRSYTIQPPSFPEKNNEIYVTKAESKVSVQESNVNKTSSPSRLSNRSYTVETPSFPLESTNKTEIILPRIKTPVPLPRRKSLVKSSVNKTEDPNNKVVDQDLLTIQGNDTCESEALIVQESSAKMSETFGEMDALDVNNHQRSHTPQNDDICAHPDKKRKHKKRRKRVLKSHEEMEMQELSGGIDSKEGTISEQKSRSCSITKETISESHSSNYIGPSEQVVGVTVHGVDCVLVDPLVRHPLVWLHVVNTDTGQYVTKSDPARTVCYHNERLDYIQPIATHPFDFKHNKSVVAQWEECLLLNEKPSHLFTPSTLLLFEVRDFVNMSAASSRHRRLGSAAAWHVVAWAFLRPIGAGGARNLDFQLKLQLYKPPKSTQSSLDSRSPTVYKWWGSAVRCKYAGCLSVTVGTVEPPPKPPSPRLRSRQALQSEVASVASVRSASGAESDDRPQSLQEMEERPQVVWSRLPFQSCKMPTTRRASLPVDGCMALQFSPSGLWLACALRDIRLYSVPEFKHSLTLIGHQGLIYCLRWSADSKLLLSASADSTVSIWRPQHHKAPLLQILAHPSYVYSAVFVGVGGVKGEGQGLVTGCCDGGVRLWRNHAGAYRLVQELSAHAGFVSAVCVTVDGSHVLTADSLGSIKIYQLDNDGCLSDGVELSVRELRGVVINNVLVHPGGQRLLVHSRDSCVRSVDIATGAVIQTFKGCSNERMQTGACVSACGSLVFACGEDGSLVAWDGYTGSLKAVYLHLLPPGSAAVHYHPHDHLLAAASLQASPLNILAYDRYSSGDEIGLNFLEKEAPSLADGINKMRSANRSSKQWQKSALITTQSTPSIKLDPASEAEEIIDNNTIVNDNDSNIPSSFSNSPGLPDSENLVEKSHNMDEKLLHIIQKMDNIILAARRTSQGLPLQV